MIKILYINNNGGGFADHIDVEAETTVGQLFDQKVGVGRDGSYLIRCNRLPCSRDQILRDGDRVSFTPVKIEGAAS